MNAVSNASVAAVCAGARHEFSKPVASRINLLAGLGVEGDAHNGVTVKHRSRVAQDPLQPNLRQVHLMHNELFAELATQGFTVTSGDLGENITTQGVNLLELPADTELHIGESAIVRVTGLRNPCSQIDRFQSGLMKAVLGRTASGELLRKTGVMSVVISGGAVCAGDVVRVQLPSEPHRALECV